MAPISNAVATTGASDVLLKLDSTQTLRASTALLRKIQTDDKPRKVSADKANLLADADTDDVEDDIPIWLILTTKKHIHDKKRLKPGKILLPHPCLDSSEANLRICLITADPQRKYKDLVAEPGFPPDLAKRIHRVLGMEKLKAKYGKSFEAQRQLFGEYDVFLADTRVISALPKVLGKTFYRGGSKRPIPVSLQGKTQSMDEQGNKRRKLSEGGTKAMKAEVRPADVAREIERTLQCALVHLAPSTTTAIKVGKASMSAEDVQENIEAVVEGMVDKFVPQKWRNMRAVHIKGPNTVALPIWLAEELWEDEQDVLDEAPPVKESKKRKCGALANGEANVIEVPGPDGQMRRLEKPSTMPKSADVKSEAASVAAKKQKTETEEEIQAKAAEKAEKAAKKDALKKEKAELEAASDGMIDLKKAKTTKAVAVDSDVKKPKKKSKA